MKFRPWWRRRDAREEDLAAELRSHLQMSVRDRVERGEAREAAEQSARREFGNVGLVKEVTRDLWGGTFLEQLGKDARYGLRSLLKNPRFTAVAILTLALGIGANSAIFSMVNALILHPYTFRNLDQLVLLRQNDRGETAVESLMTAGDATDLIREVKTFESLTIYRFGNVDLSNESEVSSVLSAAVSTNFFDLLGEQPMLGRTLAGGEDQLGQSHVAVLSYGLWKSRFGGDPSILGKTVSVNGQASTVIGVMPANFVYPVPVQLWIPLTLRADQRADRKSAPYTVLGRLRNDTSVGQAESALQAFSKRLQERYPGTNAGRAITPIRLREELYRFTIPLFTLLELAAVFVLVLACANLVNLLMARMTSREKELALRMALGANRGRLAQLIVMESMLLAVSAVALAVTASYWSIDAIRTSISTDYTQWIPGWDRIRLDPNVIGFALLVSLTVGILIGLVTAARISGADPYPKLKEGARAGTEGSKHRLRDSLVVVQMVLAMVLLVGATLMLKGFLQTTDIYQSLRPASVLVFELSLPEARYPDNRKVVSFYEQALRNLETLPGLEAATVATNLPASNVENERESVRIEGRGNLSASEMPASDVQSVGPQFLSSLGIPLIRGRALAASDGPDAPRVIMVNQKAAEEFWPRQDPIGRRLKLGASNSGGEWLSVVGVCGNMKQNWWNATAPALYLPYQQAPRHYMRFALRVATNPSQYAKAVREVIQRLDAQLALSEIHSYEKEVADSLALIRVMGMLMLIFGAVALGLATIGIYGLVAYSVSQQMHEFGVRVALGANRIDVLKKVLGGTLKLSAISVALGLPLSYALSKVMGSSIFGLVQFHGAILADFAALLVLSSLAAAFFPALRATRVDPIVALRCE